MRSPWRVRFVAVLALVVVAVIAAVASSQASGGGCGSGHWPRIVRSGSVVQGFTARVAYRRGRWRVWLRPPAGQAVGGSVNADARLSAVRTTLALHSHVRRSARTISFWLPAGAPAQSLSFSAACAHRLGFRFTAGRTAIGGQAAPTPTFILERPAGTGIAGRLVAAPTCPVGGPTSCPPARPVPGTVQIETAPDSRSAPAGTPVTTVQTDSAGNFRATLAPGAYMLSARASTPPPYGSTSSRAVRVVVEAGVISEATLVFDTGIR